MKHRNAQATLKALLAEQEQRILASFPSDRRLAVLELTRAIDVYFWYILTKRDQQVNERANEWRHLYAFGCSKALSLFIGEHCLQTAVPLAPSTKELQQWADSVLLHCGRLGVCEMILELTRFGLGKLSMPTDREIRFAMHGKHIGLEAIEREEFWILSRLADEMDRQARSQVLDLRDQMITRMSELVKPWRRHYVQYDTAPDIDAYYESLGLFWARMNFLGSDSFTGEVMFGGQPFNLYRAAVAMLAGWAWKHIDFCQALWGKHPKLELRNILTIYHHYDVLCGYMAAALDVSVQEAAQALSTVTLTPENRSAHLSVPRNYLPPLIQISSESVIESVSGTLSPSPFYFMLTELQRRFPSDWDSAVAVREGIFRKELYEVFPQEHMAKLPKPVKVKIDGNVVTDIDAVVFDTKAGVLGLFQLKWQEPFGSSMQKRETKKRNFLDDSNAWIEKVSAWLRGKTVELLAQYCGFSQYTSAESSQVLLFVLGRNFSHFSGDAEPDPRAAWGMWPQVLRLLKEAIDSQSYDASDPLSWLNIKLREEAPVRKPRPTFEGYDLYIGDYRIACEPLH